MPRLIEIINKFEKVVPKKIQWEKDNCGLQVGDLNQEIHKINICLDVTEEVVQESIEQKAELIFSHHPLIFKTLNQISYSNNQGKIISNLIKSDISVYSAHTNFDKYSRGVSFALAELLELQNIETLVEEKNLLFKIVTFVPEEHVEFVADALSEAGAGKIGEYEFCSFRIPGKGTFCGSENSNPYIGSSGQKEYVPEIRIEMVFPGWQTSEILNALRKSHPYEEIAYDIYPLANKSSDTGLGIVGDLIKRTTAADFIKELKQKLDLPQLRISGDLKKDIARVALLSGSGGSYYNHAIEKGADIFITGDVSYHQFAEASEKIIIADAGHYETEIFAIDEIVKLLSSLLKDDVEIIKTKIKTNSIKYI